MANHLARIAPGLRKLSSYNFAENFRHDVLAGLSVAAVALPVAVAYAQLAGFDPVVRLYSSILPLVAYAIFGTSRQLIVNPDAAVCAMVAAAVGPLASGNAELYWSLSVAVTFLAGLFCIVASVFRLGGDGGLPVQTNPHRILEWYRNQYLSGADRQTAGLLGRIPTHHSATTRDLRQASTDARSDTDRRNGKHGDAVYHGAAIDALSICADNIDRRRCRGCTAWATSVWNSDPRARSCGSAAASIAYSSHLTTYRHCWRVRRA